MNSCCIGQLRECVSASLSHQYVTLLNHNSYPHLQAQIKYGLHLTLRVRADISGFFTRGRPEHHPNKPTAEFTTMGATKSLCLSHAVHAFGSWQDLPSQHIQDNIFRAKPWLHHSVLGWPVEQTILTLSFAIFSLILSNELGYDFQASEVILFPNIASACSHVSSDIFLTARQGLRDARQQARPY